MIIYEPIIRDTPRLMTERESAWGDIPTILKDIIERFHIKQNVALEFGVEYGYSTSALSNYFEKVIGVDTFTGDIHTWKSGFHFDETNECLKDFPNIELVVSRFENFILNNDNIYDLIHIDIDHEYDTTYKCGEWAINHSRVTIFHDTESFQDVKRACEDLSFKYNLYFFNYPQSFGLGILVNNLIN